MERLYGRIILSVVLASVISFIIIGIINMFIMPFYKSSALKKAELNEHVIKAKKMKTIHPDGMEERKTAGYIVGVYEYEVDSKKYRYKGKYVTTPPQIETLYYKNNPKSAKPEFQFGFLEDSKYLIFLVVLFIVFWGSFFVL
mgnify:CR=1 FL=1